MEINDPNKSKIIEGGIDKFEETAQFNTKVAEIRRDLTAKYSEAVSNEKNWLKRFLIKVRLEIEINRKVRELSSLKNLHAVEFSQQYL